MKLSHHLPHRKAYVIDYIIISTPVGGRADYVFLEVCFVSSSIFYEGGFNVIMSTQSWMTHTITCNTINPYYKLRYYTH